ncbi:hypothetical protein DEFDS_P093 (plasmid) [Deferribacter desulfuricans SSM1]|uniref:Uncharacterized protein n=1 Tax=Deferribacter desulfuricans (strain DSM 14783 / JCM 11476 / NBRC 101012 / SSM1) TaxID=639282 RepID=D3PES4_DEFDS|nr:hypothetical protein [Deferribacter desulfuricans]BAI81716.1 hypothetical protein DEFDS_P093 [Deferribacter desulfuricans SSM1]
MDFSTNIKIIKDYDIIFLLHMPKDYLNILYNLTTKPFIEESLFKITNDNNKLFKLISYNMFSKLANRTVIGLLEPIVKYKVLLYGLLVELFSLKLDYKESTLNMEKILIYKTLNYFLYRLKQEKQEKIQYQLLNFLDVRFNDRNVNLNQIVQNNSDILDSFIVLVTNTIMKKFFCKGMFIKPFFRYSYKQYIQLNNLSDIFMYYYDDLFNKYITYRYEHAILFGSIWFIIYLRRLSNYYTKSNISSDVNYI